MGSERFEIADALARAAGRLDEQQSLAEALDAIVHTVVDTVPGVDHAGISTMHRSGRIETVAATDDLVLRVDEAQYATGEGPCIEALNEQAPVVVDSLDDEHRWPAFAPKANDLGVRGRMAFLLSSSPRESSALNLYSTRADAFDQHTRHVGQLYATHARAAMSKARLAQDMQQALASRKEIGQAIGIVMQRYGLDEDAAFAFLIRVSRDNNVKLREVAGALVAQANRAARQQVAPVDAERSTS